MAATATTGMNNLTTLIKRLEAATSRLEDIAGAGQESTTRSVAPSISAPSINGDATPSASQARTAAAEPVDDEPETVQDFDTMTKDDLKVFSELSEKVGGLVAQQVGLIGVWIVVKVCADETLVRDPPSVTLSGPSEALFILLAKQKSHLQVPQSSWKSLRISSKAWKL